MTDKNGVELKTGQIVEIAGAYFKNDNGLWFIAHSPGDPCWTGSDYSLHRVAKSGRPSTAKDNLGFWPICIFTNDRAKRYEGNAWNKEHATIEVKDGIKTDGIKAYFEKEAAEHAQEIRRLVWIFGRNTEAAEPHRRAEDFLRGLLAEI
nr:hypothetical protein [uncultured Dysosmobacter sp.]